MKYIKSHILFESAFDSWIRDELKDLLANLEDEGYIIRISYMGSDSGFLTILPKYMKVVIEMDNIADDIYRMNEYLRDRYHCVYEYKPGGMNRDYTIVSIDDIKSRKSNKFVSSFKVNIYSKSPTQIPSF